MITGRDLIIHILSNNLEDEPIVKDGKLVGFLTVEEAAEKMGVGTATIFALILEGQLDGELVGGKYNINPNTERFGNINE